MKPIRVLHVYRTYYPDPPGGLQEAIRQICLSTAAHGIESTVFALSPNPVPARLARPEAEVVRSRSWAAPASCDLGGLDAFGQFARLARNADVIHYQYPWPFADVLHLAVRPKAPAIITYQSDVVRQRWLGRLYAPLMHQMLGRMHAIVATSPAYAATSAVLTRPELAPRVRVIPLSIGESSYNTPADAAILKRLNLSADEPFFLFIGVLRYYKGLHTLLQAAQQMKYKVVIAGTGPEGSALQQTAAQHNLNHVIFAGQITEAEKMALLKSCRALVLPSHLRSEAFGMVLVEAAMFSKPMVSCEIGTGTSYVNAHEVTGFVVPPENPGAMAQALTRLGDDSALAQRYGLAARQRYDALFSGRAMGEGYAQLYRQALGQ